MEFKYSYFSNYTIWFQGQQYLLYNAVIGPKQSIEPQLVKQFYTNNNQLVNIWVHKEQSRPLSIKANEFFPANKRNFTSIRQIASSSH